LHSANRRAAAYYEQALLALHHLPERRIVWSLAFHPGNPQIMFLGTEGSDVYRSNDGRESWQYLSTIVNRDAVQMAFATRILGLALEPTDPNWIYAALEVGGAARSADGGKSWELVNRQFLGNVDLMDLHGVALGSPQAETLFIANRVGVWRSHDRGERWENLHLEKFSPICYSRGVQVAPNDPDTLYACVGRNFGSEEGGVLRSTDLGETWDRFDRGCPWAAPPSAWRSMPNVQSRSTSAPAGGRSSAPTTAARPGTSITCRSRQPT
jgi:hypothetical protein